jgi:hypothetical protein
VSAVTNGLPELIDNLEASNTTVWTEFGYEYTTNANQDTAIANLCTSNTTVWTEFAHEGTTNANQDVSIANLFTSNTTVWTEFSHEYATNAAQDTLLANLSTSNTAVWTELGYQQETNTAQYLLFANQALTNALFYALDGSTPGDGSALTNVAWSLAGFWQVPSHDAPTNVVALGLITGDCMGTNIQASLQAGTCVLHVASTVPGQHWYSGTRTTNYAAVTVTPTLTDFPTFAVGAFANRSTALLIVTNAVDAFGLSITVQGKTLVAP